MTTLDEPRIVPADRGRPTLFTPERLEQIKNLVERDTPREEIAAIIGCTVGSLAVTCSKHGISLRRRRYDNGVGLKPRQEIACVTARVMQSLCVPEAPLLLNDGPSPFALKLEYKGRSVPMPIAAATMIDLVMKAEMHGLRLSELLAQILQAASKKA